MPLPDHEENIPLKYLASVVGGSKRLVRCRHFNQNSDIWILDEHAHNFVELIYFIWAAPSGTAASSAAPASTAPRS